MATTGGQPGNQNAAKGRDWRDAIKRATARHGQADYRAGLDKLADEFVIAVSKGDLGAFKEFGDRIDGKVPQPVVGDDDEAPVKVLTEVLLRGVNAAGG